MDAISTLKRIRILLSLFMAGLILSGLTAFPLVSEANILYQFAGPGTAVERAWPALGNWITRAHEGLTQTNAKYPFILYGTDWLAFAHIVIAIAFIGPLRDPVKNLWVIQFGLIACVLVIPMVLIFGPIRGIPVFWRVLDCSFGVIGFIPLLFARKGVARLVTAGGA